MNKQLLQFSFYESGEGRGGQKVRPPPLWVWPRMIGPCLALNSEGAIVKESQTACI
jgi:hypothetical protein